MKWKGQIMSNRFIIPDVLLRGQKPFISSSLPHTPKQRKGTFEILMLVSTSKWEDSEQSEFSSASISQAPVLCQALYQGWGCTVPIVTHITVYHRLQVHEPHEMVQGVEWAIVACLIDVLEAMEYHFTPIRMATIKNNYWLERWCIAGGNTKWFHY